MCEHTVSVKRVWGPQILYAANMQGKCEIHGIHQGEHKANLRAADGNNYVVIWE